MCCPDDKPNYIFLTDYESWNPGAGYCTAAKFPAELSGQGVGEELLSGDYDFSDKIRGSGQVDLELMTIKDLYDTYDAKAATMMESMVGIHAADCEAETRQAVSSTCRPLPRTWFRRISRLSTTTPSPGLWQRRDQIDP